MASCYHPLKGFPVGVTDNGKTDYKICSFSVDHVEIWDNGSIVCCETPHRSARCFRYVNDYIEIPCGQCIGCRLQYSRDWANRCMLELQYHSSSYFVTLTYNDKHLPRRSYVDPETGEVLTSYSLFKKDFQNFMKRLRKALPDQDLRYFMAGEYGGKTYRPHYHAILFGLSLDDLIVYKRSELNHIYYNSPTVQKAWSIYDPKTQTFDPIGFAVVADVTWETCAYTARYVTKKLKGAESEFYTLHNLTPEFTLMSRAPGIAREYYDEHSDLYKFDYINISGGSKGLKFKPPRYYDKLYDLECPDEMAEIKANRKRIAENANKAKLQKTTLSYLELLEVEEKQTLDRTKKLIRRIENETAK